MREGGQASGACPNGLAFPGLFSDACVAVMGSRESLWARFGGMWGWQITFNYAVLNHDETELLGCVYIDPPGARAPESADALVSWWVVDSELGGDLEGSLNMLVPRWLTDRWGFDAVHYAP